MSIYKISMIRELTSRHVKMSDWDRFAQLLLDWDKHAVKSKKDRTLVQHLDAKLKSSKSAKSSRDKISGYLCQRPHN